MQTIKELRKENLERKIKKLEKIKKNRIEEHENLLDALLKYGEEGEKKLIEIYKEKAKIALAKIIIIENKINRNKNGLEKLNK